jgi:hypothetical protein
MSFHDPLFTNYMRDTEDRENLPLRDDVASYEDHVAVPGAFVEKLLKRAATERCEDDLDLPQPASLLGLMGSPELRAALRSEQTRDRIGAAVIATRKRARELQNDFGLELGFDKSLAGR